MKHTRLSRAWQAVVPGQFRPLTRLGGYKNRVVTINVRSAAAVQELSQFWKERLRRSMVDWLQGEYIRDLRFVLADFGSDHGEG